MSWAKIDDQLHASEKFAAVSLSATGLWLLCLSWAADRRTDGRLPLGIVRRLGGTGVDILAAELVDANLWEPTESGWQIHNYLEYNPTRIEQETEDEELKAVRSEAGRRGAESRWHGKNGKSVANAWQNDGKPIANGMANGWQRDAPVIPSPVSPIPIPLPPSPAVIPQTPSSSGMTMKGEGLSENSPENRYPMGWEDAEALRPGALMARYREVEGKAGEERLAAWLAAARKPVQSQAAYLRPCILGWLRGDDPDPIAVPPLKPTTSPIHDINAEVAALAVAARETHGSMAAALGQKGKS
jgi:hypothetical protein